MRLIFCQNSNTISVDVSILKGLSAVRPCSYLGRYVCSVEGYVGTWGENAEGPCSPKAWLLGAVRGGGEYRPNFSNVHFVDRSQLAIASTEEHMLVLWRERWRARSVTRSRPEADRCGVLVGGGVGSVLVRDCLW